ncbi:MAG: hypothetical protein JZU52_18075, partial [Lamprocystis purpurea]|nr:hypothetical protein [Lamprocystis purpurea]
MSVYVRKPMFHRGPVASELTEVGGIIGKGARLEWRKDKPRAYLNQLVTVAIQDQKSAFSALFLGVTVLADLLLREAPGL